MKFTFIERNKAKKSCMWFAQGFSQLQVTIFFCNVQMLHHQLSDYQTVDKLLMIKHSIISLQGTLPNMPEWLIKWCFRPLSTVFQPYHCNSSHYSWLSWVFRVLRWGSEVSCPWILPRKSQRIQRDSSQGPRGILVKHFSLPLIYTGRLKNMPDKMYLHNEGSFQC